MIWLLSGSSFSKWIYDQPKGHWHGMITHRALWMLEHESNHWICIVLQLVLLSNTRVTTSTITWLQETCRSDLRRRPALVCRHSAHHVPVELLLCEPERQRAPPTTGHCSNTMWIYRAWGETHQSTAAGFYSSLETWRRRDTRSPGAISILKQV